MAWVFNPFSCTFDFYQVATGGTTSTAGDWDGSTQWDALNIGWDGLEVTGIVEGDIKTITTNYTILTTDSYGLTKVDATSGNITITLPPAVDSKGNKYTIKKIDSTSNSVIVDGYSSETVDDGTIATMVNQYESISVMSDGTEYWII